MTCHVNPQSAIPARQSPSPRSAPARNALPREAGGSRGSAEADGLQATCPPLPRTCPPLPEMPADKLNAVSGVGRRAPASKRTAMVGDGTCPPLPINKVDATHELPGAGRRGRVAGGRNPQSDRLKWWLVGWLGKGLVDLIGSTMRIRVVDFEKARAEIESRKFIFAFWHSRILMVSYLYKGWGGATLVSGSKDGEIIAQILKRQGHETIRGSTSRQGVRALAKLIRALKEEIRPGVVVPDGPRGPRFKVQPGVITLAQKTGYPVVPVSYSAKRIKIFASWDRFILPCPFTEGSVIYGTPILVPSKVDAETKEVYRARLEEELSGITKIVDRYYGHAID